MPTDAEYCPRCGLEIPSHRRKVNGDEVLNVYRTKFECPSCDFRGEVFRTDFGGTDDD